MTGKKRRIGIELEFYGLKPKEVASLVKTSLGGQIREESQDSIDIETPLGTFRAETDATLVKKLSKASARNKENKQVDMDGWLRDAIQFFSSEFVPTELVCPPIYEDKISTITEIHKQLASEGAKGSIESIRFAFCAQLNPELIDIKADKILTDLQSFLILSDWLKNQIQVDLTRSLTSFADDFPKEYQQLVLNQNYNPDIEQLIDDYLEHNPTRNRSLDLLPLFKHIDEEKVLNKVDDELVKSRPTYHYRLPNCQISMTSWDIEIEWQRWLLVEKFSSSQEFHEARNMHLEYISESMQSNKTKKLIELNNYMERLRR